MSLGHLEKMIREDIERMCGLIEQEIMGPPQVRPMSSAEEARLRQERADETLTYELLCELERKWRRKLSTAPPVLTIIEVEPTPIYGPARRHRKRRIQKKWLKRYGMKIIGYDFYLGDQILVHETMGVAFCHPGVAAQARNMMMADEIKRF